jgi:hypothetical protein
MHRPAMMLSSSPIFDGRAKPAAISTYVENLPMKLVTYTLAIISGLALTSPAFAACDGLEGKDLKKCEKAEAKAAKSNSGDGAVLPSKLDAAFAHLDADNPFATAAYSVTVGDTGFEQVDAFMNAAAILQGKVVMARYMIDNFDAMDPAQAKAAGDTLVELLASVKDDAPKLIEEGKALANPDTLKGMASSPVEIPKLLKLAPALTEAVGKVTSVAAEAPAVIDSLKSKLGG